MSLLIEELLPKGVPLETLPEEHQKNLEGFLPKLQKLREASEIIFIVTSGYRTLAHHEEIYRIKNEKRLQAGLKPVPTPMGSQHLYGHAADILDKDRSLGRWVMNHLEYVEDLGLFMEAFDACEFPEPWVHFQDISPLSRRTFFEP